MPMVALRTGINMFYEITGDGPPLLLIMGTAADHSTWSSQVAAYNSDFTVITYDARGTGLSSAPTDPTTYSHQC
jgi:3-oxoadipate enol-lactonase